MHQFTDLRDPSSLSTMILKGTRAAGEEAGITTQTKAVGLAMSDAATSLWVISKEGGAFS